MDARFEKRLARRHRAERRFRAFGKVAIAVGLVFLAVLFVTIVQTGFQAFTQTRVLLEIDVSAKDFNAKTPAHPESLAAANYGGMVKRALRDAFPAVKTRRDKRALYRLVSSGAAFELADLVKKDPSLIGQRLQLWLTAADEVDLIIKGAVPRTAPAAERHLSDKQMSWLATLESKGQVETVFNTTFFSAGDSREPELAGIAAALLGSLFSVLVCLAFAFPLGVLSAIYLEEFAPKNRWTEFIEVNINNLAAVPSIVFGLLGLSVFLNVFELPRSAPLVGGMVLALMTLPTIIIAGRASIKAVPPSIREAALAVGASPIQSVFHHVLPLAMPGVLTGTIIGTARALGETAPLLMIGMVAFIVDLPQGILDPATALPVQVFLWADSPEKAFTERTAAAILILLLFTCLMNLAAVLLRRKYEIRW
ncbi:MAG TPA: phosphate ABC transporter permease PtsA [Rhodospirillaceae bacterium]|nr:phosphate ABC transporter, permease protein PstA [Rhodospirillaceae bacterium]HAT34426.1 phosphate ABC transporter permease PtsA [Rhodospirillaceae bacterium]